ncbi:hypothetical protein J6590_027322 [Homalodisca vitripennis]|nr:hypothetical protein J6590_027322 [Homalodisca vitripennis]
MANETGCRRLTCKTYCQLNTLVPASTFYGDQNNWFPPSRRRVLKEVMPEDSSWNPSDGPDSMKPLED